MGMKMKWSFETPNLKFEIQFKEYPSDEILINFKKLLDSAQIDQEIISKSYET